MRDIVGFMIKRFPLIYPEEGNIYVYIYIYIYNNDVVRDIVGFMI